MNNASMNAMIDKVSLKRYLNCAILTLIGLCAYGYAVWGSSFAERSIQIPGLPFPIFVGEILLAACGALSFLRMGVSGVRKFRPETWAVILYAVFVLAKAGFGYFKYPEWGALALRHAALFYYPFFGLIAYYAFESSYFNTRLLAAVLAAILLSFTHGVYEYSVLPMAMLGAMCALSFRDRRFRWAAVILLLVLIPYHSIFDSGRTRILGNAVGLTTLAGLWLFLFAPGRKLTKAAVLTVFAVGLVFVISRVADQNAIRSMVGVDELRAEWRKFSDTIAEKEKTFQWEELPVRLYNENRRSPSALAEERFDSAGDASMSESSSVSGAPVSGGEAVLSVTGERAPVPAEPSIPVLSPSGSSPSPVYIPRSLQTAFNNILFRIFIWQDVTDEIIAKRPFLGVDFGYPFKSIKLGILGWADEAWRVDGWIAVHNSYLDMVYRAGAVGLALVGVVVFFVARYIVCVIRRRMLLGIFPAAILMFWLTVGNFTEFLELPYTAILFWSFLGLTLAYCRHSKQTKMGDSTI